MMEIEIESHTKLSEIRTKFKMEFRHLDIAFFSRSHEEGVANRRNNQLDYEATFEEAGDPHRIGLLQITGDQSVSETESELEKGFGLHAQILRKSGHVYLQTTTSDDMTLSALNSKVELDESLTKEKQEPGDYHEQE